MTVPVWVINLQRSRDRAAAMRERLDCLKIEFKWFPAIDGTNMTADEIRALDPRPYPGNYGRTLYRGELGCAASHLAVLRSIGSGVDPFVCVLEDDAAPETSFSQFLQPALLNALPEFDVLRLMPDWRYSRRAALRVCHAAGREIFAPLWPGNSSVGQIYSRAGAAKILRHVPPLRGPLDSMLFCDARVPGLRVLETRPKVVDEAEGDSTINAVNEGVRRRGFPKTLPSIVRRNGFIFVRRIRSVYSFSRAWGINRTLRLRR